MKYKRHLDQKKPVALRRLAGIRGKWLGKGTGAASRRTSMRGRGAPSGSAGGVCLVLVSLRSRTLEKVKKYCACPSQPSRSHLQCSNMEIRGFFLLNYLKMKFHRDSAERKQIVAQIAVRA